VPPAAPSGLTAQKGIQSILLDWADNHESDLAGYHVYRSETLGDNYALIEGLQPDSNFTDTEAVSGTTYYYVVTAVDTSSNESVNSNEISARPFLTRGGAGMLALGECDCPGLYISGTRDANILTILNGGIHINSYNFDEAFAVGYKATKIDTEYIHAVGGVDDSYEPPTELAVHENIEPLLDPYGSWAEPEYDPANDLGTISETGTYSPGYYSGGIQIRDPNIITLQPGIYHLDSIGYDACLEMLGGTLTGEGVLLHIVGDGDRGIDVVGNANIDISAPTSGEYEGVAIFQKRDPDYDCVQSCEEWSDTFTLSEFNSIGDTIIDGTIYMPHNFLMIGGSETFITTEIVADRIEIHGEPEIVIDYPGQRSILGDFVDPGGVEFNDLLYFVQWWLTDYDVPADLNYDHRVDLADFAIIAENGDFPEIPYPNW
jgi:hypothetical protein